MTADEIKHLLRLRAHPMEGGFFRRTYTSELFVETERGKRHAGTTIYYLLEAGTFSEMHKLASDEIFHFYLGDPVEMLQLWPGQHVQLTVPADVWQGTKLIGLGQVALLGCSVYPGFDFKDYTRGSYAELAAQWPSEAHRIRELIRA
jgi:predicted cupin superfamily sugar epimerase